jgi:hypothetical protein
MLKHCLLVAVIMMIALSGFSRKFYFSAAGNDSYTTAQAQNQATPWKTLAKLNSLSAIAAAGDTFAFKRGEIFANGSQGGAYNTTGSVKWYGGGFEGRNFPSGTAQNPIVFTYYGDMNLERPNLLYPNPTTTPRSNERGVLAFANVSYIVIDGIQFNDTRFPFLDKRSGAYTTNGLWFGDSGYCNGSNGCKCNNITVKNCNFSNTAYGIVAFVRDFKIDNNTFSNFKSTGWLTDTASQADIGADPMLLSGSKYRITNNRITGSWAYANPFESSSSGLLGGAIETINNFDSSFVGYNTFIDCSGGFEFGTNQPGGVQGPDDDTVCYNKFINCSNIAYVNTTGTYGTQVKNIHFWNNFFVEGSMSRMSGNNAGGDAMGDGQTYANSGFIYWPPYPINKSTRYPNSQNFQSAWRPIASGVHTNQNADTVFDIRNNIFWINNGFFAKYTQAERPKTFYRNNVYHLVSGYQNPAEGPFTPTSLGEPGVTLATGERIRNGRMIVDSSSIYPQNWDMRIISDTAYAASNGMNVGLTRDFAGNAVGATPSIGIFQFTTSSGPAVTSVTPTSGSINQAVTIRGRNFTGATSVVLRTAVDANLPFTVGNDSTIFATMALQSSQYVNAPNGGVFIVTTANGSNVSSPAFVYNPPVTPSCTFVYDGWGTCNSGVQTRTYLTSPSGCAGVPDRDSISRPCTTPIVSSLTFSASLYAILVTSNVPGQLSISNSSGQIVLTLPYGPGSSTINVTSLTPGNYTATTFGISLGFSTSVKVSLVSRTRPTCRTSTNGAITVIGSLGTAPYTYSINSTSAYGSSGTFSNLRRGTYNIRCKDATNTVTRITVTLNKLSSVCN